MKAGDIWICSICKTEIVCDDWGVKHSVPGHSINFRKEHAGHRDSAKQIGFSKQEFDAIQLVKSKDKQQTSMF
jgi:hypothetical protein